MIRFYALVLEGGISAMRFERMKQRIRDLEAVAVWPEMIDLIERAAHQDCRSIWEYPVLACEAVGGRQEDSLPGAAAVFCTLASIHLVDDILDDDPLGDYHKLGVGYTANLALAFQAAAHRILQEAATEPAVQMALQGRLALMGLATAYGQALDAREISSEADYWKVVGAKTPPLLGGALYIGACLGGARLEVAEQLERLGDTLGRYIQVSDDLADALEAPAKADWARRNNNLPILYASTVDHPERQQFLELADRVADPDCLYAAQHILMRSGALSYCVYRLTELAKEARGKLAVIPLADPEPLERLLAYQNRPIENLLERLRAAEPIAAVR
jgi:geranylgeranyl pyrophosphate synthase